MSKVVYCNNNLLKKILQRVFVMKLEILGAKVLNLWLNISRERDISVSIVEKKFCI